MAEKNIQGGPLIEASRLTVLEISYELRSFTSYFNGFRCTRGYG